MKLSALAFLGSLATTASAQTCSGRSSGGSIGRKYGPYVSFGPTQNEIVRMETIYTPGKRPTSTRGVLSLWPGINNQSNRGSDLIQTVIESSGRGCGSPEMWCLAPVAMHGYSVADWDKRVPIAPDAQIKIIYSKSGTNWVQTTIDMKTGKKLHEYIRGSGAPKGWGTGTEVQGGHPGTVDTQYYVNTTIELARSDPSFARTQQVTGSGRSKAISTAVKTTDNKIFTVEKITLPPWSDC